MQHIKPSSLRHLRPHLHLRHYSQTSAQTPRSHDVEIGVSRGRQSDLSGLGPRRFYERVDIHQHPNSWFGIHVDDKPLKTGHQRILSTPHQTLSLAIAAEWDAQVKRIRPSSMPLTRIVSTALDVVPEFRKKIVGGVMKFVETDTVCFRVDRPESLVKVQDSLHGPVVEWVERRFGVVMPVVRGGLVSVPKVDGLERVKRWVEELDDLKLAALDCATASAKSLAVAAMMCEGVLDPSEALHAARSEEIWQESVWGSVEGGHDLDSADTFVRLLAADNVFKFSKVQRNGSAFPTSLERD